ncbi:phosphoribosyltransferase family protein [Pseudothauera rhizosphaerae]|uniref:Phosphoribosyltransferase n=1 Tax=Pseudothauera rhizosphaerae TaxID=2565932 RepID=A0A4S4AS44_9RHOO|nr:phosphoribosyltransferase family protein [Pseudothauera rhizosphaerae]THF62625.1 phosphoribosyltransferase [Pseudothauera rhizosphaerae]
MDQAAPRRSRLYDAAQLAAVLDAMALQAAGLLAGAEAVALVGVLRRGAPLADMLAERLGAHGVAPPRRVDLAISRYADDLTLLYPQTRLLEDAAHAAPDLEGHTVLLVDDVLYTGHSLLRAVDWLVRRHAECVRVAVLAERCIARLPLHADVVGVRLQVAPGDIVECHVPPYEPAFAIELVHRPAAAPGNDTSRGGR